EMSPSIFFKLLHVRLAESGCQKSYAVPRKDLFPERVEVELRISARVLQELVDQGPEDEMYVWQLVFSGVDEHATYAAVGLENISDRNWPMWLNHRKRLGFRAQEYAAFGVLDLESIEDIDLSALPDMGDAIVDISVRRLVEEGALGPGCRVFSLGS